MPDRLSDDDVRKVAKLGRLRLTDDEVHHFAGQLSAVLGYMEKLNELDVTGVEPMAHASDVTNVLRGDEPGEALPVEAVLANAPSRDDPFFKVPKVIGEGSGA